MKVSIGHKTIEIIEWDFDDPNQSGELDENDQFNWLIKIKRGLTKEQFKKVLYHEVLHGLFRSTGWTSRFQGETEEDLIMLLENQFYDCWESIRDALDCQEKKRHSRNKNRGDS